MTLGLTRPRPGELPVEVQTLVGLCLFLLGRHTESADAFEVALAMKHELDDTMGMGYALEGTAWLSAAQHRYPRTAWLLGAADSLWRLVGSRLGRNATVEALHAEAQRAATEGLGAERFRALFRHGSACPLELIVRLALDGADDLPPDVTGQLDGSFPRTASTPLTTRELEIAALVSDGLSNREIAERLVISKRTVDAHIEHIFGKLGVSSRVQLAAWLRHTREAATPG